MVRLVEIDISTEQEPSEEAPTMFHDEAMLLVTAAQQKYSLRICFALQEGSQFHFGASRCAMFVSLQNPPFSRLLFTQKGATETQLETRLQSSSEIDSRQC